MRFFSNIKKQSNISNTGNISNNSNIIDTVSLGNTIKRSKLKLRKPDYKFSKGSENRPVIELPLPPEIRDWITEAVELFSLELVGYGDKIFTENEKIYFDERAGIYEYEAGLSREEAEKKTYKEIN